MKPQYSAADRLFAIAPLVEYDRQRKSGTPQASQGRDRLGRFSAVGAVQGGPPSLVPIAKQIAAEHGISIGSVWGWRRRYQQGGYAALGRRRRADFGRSAYFLKRPDLERVVRARLAAGSNALSIAKALRALFGSESPSYDTVARYSRRAQPAVTP